MTIEIKRGSEIHKKIERISVDESDEILITELDKKYVSLDSLKEFLISDQRNKYNEAFSNEKPTKSTMSKLLEALE